MIRKCAMCGAVFEGEKSVCGACERGFKSMASVMGIIDGLFAAAETDMRIASTRGACEVCARAREDCERYDRRCEKCREAGRCMCEICDSTYSKFEWRGLNVSREGNGGSE